MQEIIAAYMVNGTVRIRPLPPLWSQSEFLRDTCLQLPTNNTVCEVDADFEVFEGVTTAHILANLPGGRL